MDDEWRMQNVILMSEQTSYRKIKLLLVVNSAAAATAAAAAAVLLHVVLLQKISFAVFDLIKFYWLLLL